MVLRKRVVEVPFGFGQNEGSHEIPLEGPSVAVLGNARILKSGGVEPRAGYTSEATFTNGTPLRLSRYGDTLLMAHKASSDSLNSPYRLFALNNGRMNVQGGGAMTSALTEATIYDRVPISRDAASEVSATSGVFDIAGECEQKNPDFAYDADTNLLLIAWQQRRESGASAVGSSAIYAEVRDATTLVVVTPAQWVSSAVSAAAKPRCINHDGSFYVVYDTMTDGDIRAVEYDQTFQLWTTDAVIVNDLDTTAGEQFWDAVEIRDGVNTGWILAYRSTVTDLQVVRVAGVTPGATATIAEVPDCVALYADATGVWVFWTVAASSLIRYAIRATTGLGSSLAATTIYDYTGLDEVRQIGAVGFTPTGATSVVVTWTNGADLSGAPAERCRSAVTRVTSTGDVGSIAWRAALVLVTRPEVVDGIAYANYLYDGSGQGSSATSDPGSRESDGFATVFTVALNATSVLSDALFSRSWRAVASWLPGVAGGDRDRCTLGRFRKIMDDPDNSGRLGIFAFPVTQEVVSLAGFNEDVPLWQQGANGIDLCRMQFDAPDRFKAVEFGPNLVIAGAVTSVFDGARLSEYGFFWPPECSDAAEQNGGGYLSAGSYAYAALFEYRLATGDIVRSAPAVIRWGLNTGAASNEVDALDYVELKIRPCTLTQKFDGSASTADDLHLTAGIRVYRTEANGDILYLDSAEVDSSVTYSLTNNPFHLTFAQFLSGDTATFDEDAALLTRPQIYTLGQLPNYAMPATDDLVVHQNRLWGISSEDKREILFTHTKEAGELPGWHPFLVLRIDDGGPCVGLASLDEKLVVFKRDTVYVVHGNGPDRNGVGASFQIVKVHTEHGCRDRRSIVNIPQGIMFASRAGICLLARNFAVQFVGGPVEDTESGKEYVSAVAVADKELVYFQVRDHAQTTGSILVYHWDSGQWSVDTVRDSQAVQVPMGGAYVGGTYYSVFSSDLNVYSNSGYSDSGTEWIPMSLTTPWLKVGGMQGYGRCWWASVIGKHRSAHGLTVTVAADYDSTNQTVTFSEAEVTAFGRYQPKIHVAQQVAQSFKFTLTTTAPAGSHGSQCIWNGLALEVGTKGGIRRQPSARMEG